MNFSTYRFTLDLHKHQSQMSIAVFQYDTAIKLSIGITDGGVPYYLEDGVVAVLFGEKENGEPIAHTCMIEENTRIIYTFNKETANEIGVVNCQIRFYKDGEEILAAPKFIIVVGERVVNDTQVFDSGDGAFEEQFSALDNLFTSESARIIAEKARVEAEKERDGNERIREEKELTRQTFEAQRQTEEAKRVKAEEERAKVYDTKLDKSTKVNKAYGTDLNGNQAMLDISDKLNLRGLAKYSEGRLKTVLPKENNDCVNKEYADELNTVMSNRVSELESLTLVNIEDTSTDYEKVVPAEVKSTALLKMIGGASEKVRLGKNLIDPKRFSNPYNCEIVSVNADGSVDINIFANEDGYASVDYIYSDEEFPNEFYYVYTDGNPLSPEVNKCDGVGNIYFNIPLVTNATGMHNIKVMIFETDDEIEDDWDKFLYAPEGTVFEPYREEMVNADVERVESLGKNRLPSDVLNASNWEKDGGWNNYYLTFLTDGWYCLSLKLKEDYKRDTYFYLQKSLDGGNTYIQDNVGYSATGYINKGYTITNNGLNHCPIWFKVDKKAGIVYRFTCASLTQSKLDWIYDIQIEKVNLTQEPSISYPPSTYAPATAYSPYRGTIAELEIPFVFRDYAEGYGREGSYLECRDGVWYHIVTKDENLNILPEPIEEEVPVTIPTSIMVEGGGTLRFVNEKEIPVPNTIGYVKRKE